MAIAHTTATENQEAVLSRCPLDGKPSMAPPRSKGQLGFGESDRRGQTLQPLAGNHKHAGVLLAQGGRCD